MARTGTTVPRGGIATKALYSFSCIAAAVVMTVSAVAYYVVRTVGGIGGSHAIVSGPSTGPQNILLMGLESRTDWNGNILPNSILGKLHAGSRRGIENGVGGNATNTLILIHIPAGGKKAIGFSIPRDDWVTFAGTVGPQQQGKIDQAYGVSMYYEEAKLRQQTPNLSQDQLAFLGNEAGRKAAVATVEKLTGVHIDHFAEVNLYGFYELAKVFGGVDVCLKHAVNDPKSGAHFRRGFHHLNASQALAFVRQRDGLTNGDLDRTHRQQAFIDSVLHQLRTQGVLGDLTKVGSLLAVAKRYVITDSGWNLLDFAAEARGLTNGNIVFHTLPIKGYQVISGQDANVVDPAYIKALVQSAFYAPPAPDHSAHRHHASGTSQPVTVDVFNGASVFHLASRVSAALVNAGYLKGKVQNTSYRTTTTVEYGSGAKAAGRQIAALFGVTAVATASVPAGHVEVLLGVGATVPQVSSPAASGNASHGSAVTSSPSPSATIPNSGPQGGAVTAVNGVPCVD